MKASLKVGIVLILVLGISGTGALLYYKNAYENIDYDVKAVIVDDATFHKVGLIITSLDMDLRIFADIVSKTGVHLKIDGATYKVDFDGVYIGNGEIGPFEADAIPSELVIEFNATLGTSVLPSLTKLIAGENVTVTFTILTITVFGQTLEINKSQDNQININDFIE